ncbi:MAG TPA: TIGR01841 family phasin [Albitalea sp.]
MLTVEQVLSVQKTQLGNAFGASAKVVEGVEKLARLNLETGRATLDQCADACRAMLGMSDPQQLVALQTAALEPTAAKWTGYAGQVYAIVAATGAELRQIAEQSASEAQSTVLSALEAVLANTPAGSDNATAMVRQAFEAANNAFQNVQSAWRQAGEAADAQVETLTAAARGKRSA